MEKKKLISLSLLHALAVFLYIFGVAWVLMNAGKVFPKMNETIFGPITFLLLFVTSAAITGSLVLGKPVMLYLEKQKKDAVLMFVCTVIWIAFFTILALISNIFISML